MAPLKLFFTYFGGKWAAAKRYPIPTHDTIIEPFAGSAGYSLHYPERNIMLYDKDPIICGLWDYLIKASEADILKLPTEITDLRIMNMAQEEKWLIGFWLNKGSASPRNMPSTWMKSNTRPKSYWGHEIRNRIATQLQYIRHWKIKNIGYNEIPDIQGSWFIDPPYQRSGVLYRYSSKGIDYEELSKWCRSRTGSTIVCEQEGANWLPFSQFRTIQALHGKKGSKISKEIIWTKGIELLGVTE